ncbi:glycosyltransferase [Arthrobacter sp. NA-172]|uniref:glycosyltransferase n=1 Tax=Arthrobacter sp. NA-172 TaxID=3367524 RepID=UPI003754DA01
MKPSSGGLALEIIVPVFNESAILERSIHRLADYLSRELLYSWKITIADNASTDATGAISRKLASELPNVGYRRLETKGRGFALRDAWMSSEAKVLAYVDVDLSTDLAALPRLSRRCFPDIPTSASAPDLAGPPGWSGAPSGKSSPAATTFSSNGPCRFSFPMPNADSRPFGQRSLIVCFPTSRTTAGSSIPNC